jgi:hypothetical protein
MNIGTGATIGTITGNDFTNFDTSAINMKDNNMLGISFSFP